MAISPALNIALNRPLNKVRQVKSATMTIPAPFGGWNTRDMLDTMPPQDAVTLDNWFPDVGQVNRRKGYTEHATGVTSGDVESLIPHNGSVTQKLLAASGTSIYDVTTSGAGSLISSAFSNGRWQFTNMNNFVLLGNAMDAPQKYDGTTLSNLSVSGTGLTIINLDAPNVFKSRIYWVEKGTKNFWYGGVDQIEGILTKFDLSFVSAKGGKLIASVAWSRDGGSGPDDFIAFIMSTGQVLVYQGSNPGDATDWAIVGDYRVGAPLSNRSAIKILGDIVLITKDDYVFLSRAIRNDGAITEKTKLYGALHDALSQENTFGWQAVHYSAGNYILFNVPTSPTEFDQHVINTVTGAACRFKGMNAFCWAVFNDNIYFGAAGGKVFQADNGLNDDGADIQADAQTAWTGLGVDQIKKVSALRHVISAEGILNLSADVLFDFTDKFTASPSSTSATGTPWSSAWRSPWSPEANIVMDWVADGGFGYKVSSKIRNISKNQNISWFRTDYRFEPGVGL